jgi:hypothetical protein
MRDFPPPAEYAKMLSTPQAIRLAFRDPVLKASKVELDAQQMPRVRSGAFAVVYKITLPDGRSHAVRLFLKDGDDRRERYALIHEYLAKARLPCLVTFKYVDDAFRAADGKRYPMMTMDWVEGKTLFDWLHDRAICGDGRSIATVAAKWREIIGGLRGANIAHGDLQHANVMVTPSGDLKLVDYDGMCVPKLVGRRNLEIGVDPYQHPGRNADTTLGPTLDNFSSIVLQTCLLALAADTGLWREFVVAKQNEKILFERADFESPEKSAIFQRLGRSVDPGVRKLSAVIADLWKKRIDQVPSLEEMLGAFDFGQVHAALDKRDFDAAVGLLERNGKCEDDAPVHLRPRIRDALQRVAKLSELMQAVDEGNESAMPALAASPQFRDYPAAAPVLAVARDASQIAPIIGRLEMALKCHRGRDLVREWDAAISMLTRPTGALRKSATRFAAEVQRWRIRNSACDRVIACLRQIPPDASALASAWRDLVAAGGHPECDSQRGRIESMIKTIPAGRQPGRIGLGSTPVAATTLLNGSRPISLPGSRAAAVPVIRPPGGGTKATAAVPGQQPPTGPSAAGTDAGGQSRASMPLPLAPPAGEKVGSESRLGAVAREFGRELGKASHDLACRWLPPVRWVSDRTPWHRLDLLTGAMVCHLAVGACCGGVVGIVVAQGVARSVQGLEPSSAGSTEWLLWRGAAILPYVAFTVTSAGIGMAISRNRLFQRPVLRIHDVGRSVVAGLGGGLIAGGLSAAMAMPSRRSVNLTGGPEASWSFFAGWTLAALATAVALCWVSARVVPNVSRLGLVTVSLVASCLAAIGLRSVAVFSGELQWFPLCIAAAIGCGAFGAGLALAEALSIRPYLAVVWPNGRRQRLNLGQTPVAAGSNRGGCDIVVSRQIPLAIRYWIEAGHCYVLDYATSQPARIGIGDRRALGAFIMTVEAARAGSPAAVSVSSGSQPAWVGGGTGSASGSRGSGGSSPGPLPPPPSHPRRGTPSQP